MPMQAVCPTVLWLIKNGLVWEVLKDGKPVNRLTKSGRPAAVLALTALGKQAASEIEYEEE